MIKGSNSAPPLISADTTAKVPQIGFAKQALAMGYSAINPHFPNTAGITLHSCLIHQKVVQHIAKVTVPCIYFKTKQQHTL